MNCEAQKVPMPC